MHEHLVHQSTFVLLCELTRMGLKSTFVLSSVREKEKRKKKILFWDQHIISLPRITLYKPKQRKIKQQRRNEEKGKGTAEFCS